MKRNRGKRASSLEQFLRKKKKKPVVSAECAPGDLVTLPSSFSCSLYFPSLLPSSSPPQPRLLFAWLLSNPGLEQSWQGQSDSASRLEDDLLAGLREQQAQAAETEP